MPQENDFSLLEINDVVPLENDSTCVLLDTPPSGRDLMIKHALETYY